MERTWLLIAFICLVHLTGCTGDEETIEDPTDDEVMAILGFDQSEEGQEVRTTSMGEFELFLVECMREEGFNYPAGYVSGDAFNSEEALNSSIPYMDNEGRSLYDPSFVEEYGYGFTAVALHDSGLLKGGTVPGDLQSLEQQMVDELSPEEHEAFLDALGSGENGCVGEARSKSNFGRINSTYVELMSDVSEEIDDRLDASPEYNEIIRQWSECMEKSGYDVSKGGGDPYEDIHSQINSVFLSVDTPSEDDFTEVLEYEIEMAKADLLQCHGGPKAQKKLDDIQVSIEHQIVEDNIGAFIGQ
jgi:hypothetical protein